MFDAIAIRKRIVEVATQEAGLSAEVAGEAAFHLTDWLDDLTAFVEFCKGPDSHTPDQVNTLLLALLHHAPNHVAAAAKLYAGFPVSDVFGVGAVEPANEKT